MYGDVETFLRDWADTVLADHTPTVTVIVEPEDGMPPDLAYRLPLVAVARFGGADDTITLDTANVDIDAYCADHQHAYRLARRLWTAARLDLPGHHADRMVAARVRTLTAAIARPWDAQQIRKAGFSAEVAVHHRLGAGL